MNESTLKFRDAYRRSISNHYNGYVHAAFVATVGLTFICYAFSQTSFIKNVELLNIPITLVIWNFIEFHVHRRLGHTKTKLGRMFYKRHTGDHHTFYDDQNLIPDNHKDWRVTLFPAWLVIVVAIAASLSGWCLSQLLSENAAFISSASLMAGYLLYEVLHFCDHLPANHFIAQLPWFKQMRNLHRLHHRKDLMRDKNFNLTFPLADWILGTLYWESPKENR